MSQAKWIWYFGDFEIYHHMLLSCRRQEFGCDYPCSWHISRPELSVRFTKSFKAEHDFAFTVISHSHGMVRLAGKFWPVNSVILCPAGEHTICVDLYDIEKFPSLFTESEFLISDESWIAEAYDHTPSCVGYLPVYSSPTDDPSVFPFWYTEIFPSAIEKISDGILYDFGKETFAKIDFCDLAFDPLLVVYGESREEALDADHAILWEKIEDQERYSCPARAFRYILLQGKSAENVHLRIYYEYLPLEDRASFQTDNSKISSIWNICAYTFHLNTREFFLDGIKRDRWVWSGDAYQSFMIARYLYNDPSVTERTIVALLGKPPYRTHVNKINDYSAYLILSVWEHYYATGNIAFVTAIWDKICELFRFIVSRLDENGYVVPRRGDWIFIDWGTLDKEGPHCAEQILLWKTYLDMAALSEVMGESPVVISGYRSSAEKLRSRIISDYFDREKGAFVDSFSSGKRFVTRQTNAFALLFDFADADMKESVIKNGLLCSDLPEITTPYFKLYELLTLCKIGMLTDAQTYIESYWGGMLAQGATSVWEAYDPAQSGTEHYAMYGSPYGKSLCHAWGSGPILLLCKYCAGVTPTSVGAKTFDVAPVPGLYRQFSAVIPVREGTVKVNYSSPHLSVCASVPGGTLVYGNQRLPLHENETVCVLLN